MIAKQSAVESMIENSNRLSRKLMQVYHLAPMLRVGAPVGTPLTGHGVPTQSVGTSQTICTPRALPEGVPLVKLFGKPHLEQF